MKIIINKDWVNNLNFGELNFLISDKRPTINIKNIKTFRPRSLTSINRNRKMIKPPIKGTLFDEVNF